MKSKTADSNAAEDANDEVIPEELKDPMSGYASADALGSECLEHGDVATNDRLRDPMSGYSSADALDSRPSVNDEGTDSVHADEMKDAMSGYASADALEPDQK
jgi:hypothetical protein